MNEADVTKHIKFQRAVYKVLLCGLGWIYTIRSKFTYERYKPKNETFLLLGNHNMNLDPFQAVIGTGSHMRFVSNDAVLKSFWGPVVSFFVGPIPRKRGTSSDETVELILANLRAGISVAMYPESERSWDGLTEPISVKTAVIAKESGAGLITYATNGGYLRTPHWARNTRNGKTWGHVVNEYSPAQLESMSVDEVYEAICSDLRVNAFEFQRQHMFRYKGSALAENSELLCYICPKCESMDKMSSKGDILRCNCCGYEVRYNSYGFFEGDDVVFDNTVDWSLWQKSWLKEHAQELKKRTAEPMIINDDVKIFKREENDRMSELVQEARLSLYGDRIEVETDGKLFETFRLEDISKLGAFGNHMLLFTCAGQYYKITCESGFISEYIYYGLWRVLTDREYY